VTLQKHPFLVAALATHGAASPRIGQTQTVNAYRLITRYRRGKNLGVAAKQSQNHRRRAGEEGFVRSLTALDLEYLFVEG